MFQSVPVKHPKDPFFRSTSARPKPLTNIMKMFIVFAAILAVTLAAPQRQRRQDDHHPEVVLLKETPLDNIGIGGYRYAYELSDGQSREEAAEVINEGTENESLRVTGSYSWTDADGQVYTVHYVADENGFRPQGAHIPA